MQHGAQIVFRLPGDLDRELRDLAGLNERSIAGELRVAVRRHLERSTIERQVAAMTDEELDELLSGAGVPDGRGPLASPELSTNDDGPDADTPSPPETMTPAPTPEVHRGS